jgi:serine phosphatase RsbU (regulator of sigma subunit)
MLLLTTTFIFGGFMLIYYETTLREMDKELSQLSEFLGNYLSTSLIKPIWDTDSKAIDGVMEAAMNEKQVCAIFVKDTLDNAYGKMRNEHWKTVSVSEVSFPHDAIVRKRNIIRKDESLGTLEICLTPKFMRMKLNSAMMKMLITLAVLDTLLFLLLFFSIRKTVISPVKEIAAYLRRLSAGDIPEVISQKYRGEFNEIKNSLNMLIDATHQTIVTAEGIAAGDLEIEIRQRSANDRMMQALQHMIQKLNEIMEETGGMIQAVGMGKLDIRGNAESYQGGWQELVRGINDLIEGLSGAVSRSAALAQEMELSRKIQTSLLPTSTENLHPELEISAAMIPADHVGGDFYDITFDKTGSLWVAVGDVSGHGVTPGLIMMMAQTVHTTVTTNLDCDARSVVVKINEILYKNVNERLNETHFMTFTALKYLGAGRFQYAGAHLSMIVFRQKTGTCELIKTKGVYLNFKKDISRATKNSEFSLDPGDTLVLYTDGLTEAENSDGNLLDIDGFLKIIEKHAHRIPEAMRDTVMADVVKWCGNRRADDMSLVIVRRNEAGQI